MIDEALTILKYLHIVHHIRGRIRLKADPAILYDPFFKKAAGAVTEEQINRIGTSLPGVIDTRVNLRARSMIIRYDPQTISPQELEALVSAKDEEVSREILEKYRVSKLVKEVVDV